MSEINKEQAEQCAAKGIRAFNDGDAASAVRLLTKALRLYDLGEPIRRHLMRAEAAARGEDASDSPSHDGGGGSSARSSGAGGTRASNSADSNADRPHGNGTSSGAGAAPFSSSSTNDGDGMRHRANAANSTANAARGAASSSSAAASSSGNGAATSSRSAGARSSATTGPRPAAPARERTPPPTRPYTPEQVELVRKLKAAKNHYDALGVARDADEDAIKKSYKKVALKVHPDKNSAPGADEAFKRVGHAVAVLTDAQKRREYDLYGEQSENATVGGGGGGGMRQQYYQRHEDEMSPEDIFNQFFGSAFGVGMGGGGRTVYQTANGQFHVHRFGTNSNNGGQRRYQQQQQGDAEGGGARMMQFMQLLPLLMFFLFSLMSWGGGEERAYQLKQDRDYSVSRETKSERGAGIDGIRYFVRPEYEIKLRRDYKLLERLDQQVVHETYREWNHACTQEVQKENQLVYSRDHSSGPRRHMYEKHLRDHEKAACGLLQKHFPHWPLPAGATASNPARAAAAGKTIADQDSEFGGGRKS